MVQLVISSDNIAPKSPKRAPEAPTEILFLTKREERTLPPNPDTRYITPILTEMKQTNNCEGHCYYIVYNS